jgi:hypothetical protein
VLPVPSLPAPEPAARCWPGSLVDKGIDNRARQLSTPEAR